MNVDIQPQKTNEIQPVMHTNGEYQRYHNTGSGISPLLFPPSEHPIKWTSYEHDESGYTTEKAEAITKMHLKRRTKEESLIQYLKENVKTINEFGSGDPCIFTFGSTTMSVHEAITHANLPYTIVQPIYLQPFPTWDLLHYSGRKAVVVEQNSTGQLEQLLQEKCGIKADQCIRQFDGRPFDPESLIKQLKKVSP
jgi:2-oxoglutarate ferredoxin oxidoreductase subunit alpha